MTNYKVDVFLGYDPSTLFESFTFKVKHFRLSKGRKINPYGGFTCLFDVHRGLVFSAKCRETEQFSKKKGILTCLQKMLNTKKVFLINPSGGTDILSSKFGDNCAIIWIGGATDNLQMRNWWLEV